MAYPAFTATAWPGSQGATAADYRNLFKVAYRDFVGLQVQVLNSKLQRICIPESMRGDPLYIEKYKAISLTTRSAGQQYGSYPTGYDKPYSFTQTERRLVRPSFYEFAEFFEKRHERAWMRAIRPDGQYAKNVTAAFNRRKDDTIIAAFDATVTLDGHQSGGDGTAPPTTGANGMTIWRADPRLAGLGGTSSVMNLGKIILAARLLDEAGAEGKRYAVISPNGMAQLLDDATISSADYNTVRALVAGTLENATFMGFEWIKSNRYATGQKKLSAGSGVNTTGYDAHFLTEDAMCFGFANDVEVRMDEIPQRGYGLQAWHSFGIGAVRLDEQAIVRVQHAD